MSVKRYSVGYKDSASGRYAAMLDKQDGGYVSYEDYDALEEKLAESQREFRAADATIENLQMQLEKLAAENAGLKRFPDQIVSFIGKLGSSEIGRDTKEKIEFAANKVQTPATDALLAELRAQGVEMLRDSIAEIEGGIEDTIDLHHYCSDFATEIRKGVQS